MKTAITKVCNECGMIAKRNGYKIAAMSVAAKEKKYFCQMSQYSLPEVAEEKEVGSCSGHAVYAAQKVIKPETVTSTVDGVLTKTMPNGDVLKQVSIHGDWEVWDGNGEAFFVIHYVNGKRKPLTLFEGSIRTFMLEVEAREHCELLQEIDFLKSIQDNKYLVRQLMGKDEIQLANKLVKKGWLEKGKSDYKRSTVIYIVTSEGEKTREWYS